MPVQGTLEDRSLHALQDCVPLYPTTCRETQDSLQDWGALSSLGEVCVVFQHASLQLPGGQTLSQQPSKSSASERLPEEQLMTVSAFLPAVKTDDDEQGQKPSQDTTFLQLRPDLSYDILHQEGPTLPVSPNVFLGWGPTERKKQA